MTERNGWRWFFDRYVSALGTLKGLAGFGYDAGRRYRHWCLRKGGPETKVYIARLRAYAGENVEEPSEAMTFVDTVPVV